MKTKNLFLIWAGMYILCLVLSFIPVQNDFLQLLFTFISIVFFVPGVLLLLRGVVRPLRLISGLSLLLSCIAILLNLLSITGSQALGNVMHILLLLVCVPMATCSNWLLSLFLWACLFIATFLKKR